MEEFPSNSQRARVPVEPKKIERVTSAEAGRRKRGLGRKFKDAFIGGDPRMAAEYMVTDVFIPAIQDTVIDAVQGGFERWIRGEGARPRRRGGAPSNAYSDLGHVDYTPRGLGTRSSSNRTPTPRMLSRKSRAKGAFDELIIPSRGEAEEVIDQMFEILGRYGAVSVADLYELTGVQSSHTDMKWGWLQLRGAKAVRLRQGGFLLDLPEPEPLD